LRPEGEAIPLERSSLFLSLLFLERENVCDLPLAVIRGYYEPAFLKAAWWKRPHVALGSRIIFFFDRQLLFFHPAIFANSNIFAPVVRTKEKACRSEISPFSFISLKIHVKQFFFTTSIFHIDLTSYGIIHKLDSLWIVFSFKLINRWAK
jgi:hypothetical protein